jgi:adenylate cyclase
MRAESIAIIITVLGAIIATLSHGLQLVDRVRQWRSGRNTRTAASGDFKALPAVIFAAGIVMFATAGGVAYWLHQQASVGSSESTTQNLAPPNGPSVAVMPFRALGSTEDANVIADGLTQNITTALSALPNLLVIARNSVLPYRGQEPELSKVGREQGVRNVLSGSVQRDSNKLRVTVNLNEAATGRQLWSDRYDRRIEDLFDVEDDIALSVATALQTRLTDGEQAQFRRRGTRNLEAWRLTTLGFDAFLRYDAASNAEARRLSEEALRLDPNYPWAWSTLASARLIAARFGYADDPAAMLAQAKQAADRAIALDPRLAQPHGVLGVYHLMRGEFDAAEAMGRRALGLEPSNAETHALLAQTLFFRGHWQDAVELSRKAVRLSPVHPSWYLIWHAWGSVYAGEAPEALTVAKRMVEIAESPAQRAVASDSVAFALVEMGRLDEAKASISSGLDAAPGHNIAFHRRTMHFEDPANFRRFEAAMQKAGLPE